MRKRPSAAWWNRSAYKLMLCMSTAWLGTHSLLSVESARPPYFMEVFIFLNTGSIPMRKIYTVLTVFSVRLKLVLHRNQCPGHYFTCNTGLESLRIRVGHTFWYWRLMLYKSLTRSATKTGFLTPARPWFAAECRWTWTESGVLRNWHPNFKKL